jgi:hypothetical protein
VKQIFHKTKFSSPALVFLCVVTEGVDGRNIMARRQCFALLSGHDGLQ